MAKEYELILKQEEDLWKQRAKQHWLAYSDTNSRYFHAAITARKKHNSFDRLKDEHEDWRTWGDGLDEVIIEYFEALFTSYSIDDVVVLNLIHARVRE